MEFRHEHRFAARLERVSSMLADADFARARAVAAGSTSHEVTVDGDVDGEFTVSIRRVVPASSIPAEARSLVGSSIRVFYTEAWGPIRDASRLGTFAVEIVGAPGHVRGSLALTEADDATAFVAEGDARVQVPFFGPMIERALVDSLARGFAAELAEADAWLAER